uniref:Uncharacterized protein n=1 Tax=Anguilla anguilla TaxID=7936 RepID=A0A0E9SXT5_ANGAN
MMSLPIDQDADLILLVPNYSRGPFLFSFFYSILFCFRPA